MGTGFCVHIVT